MSGTLIPPRGTVTAPAGSDEALLQAWTGFRNSEIENEIAIRQRVLALRSGRTKALPTNTTEEA